MSLEKTLRTLAYYDNNAEHFFQSSLNIDTTQVRQSLTQLLPPGAHILDVGCGSGRDSKAFLDDGFRVTSIDGSIALAELASNHIGQPVLVCRFQELQFIREFDGIYANGSLLHLDDEELLDVFKRLFRCLRPNGYLLASFKIGDGVREDTHTGRLFNDMNSERIVPFIEQAGAKVVKTSIDADIHGRSHGWLRVIATIDR